VALSSTLELTFWVWDFESPGTSGFGACGAFMTGKGMLHGEQLCDKLERIEARMLGNCHINSSLLLDEGSFD
jgi:hypothetical protein